MAYSTLERVLAIIAIVPAAATLYFFGFWSRFEFFRRHIVLAFTWMLGTIGGFTILVVLFRAPLLALAVETPPLIAALGWIVIAVACLFGTIADRQIGFRVRAFMPFFEDHGRIELQTSGAYGIVRHPIYASGLWFQTGALLVTGSLAVLLAIMVFGLGALWFTRQEEQRLITLLDDPTQYDRYRQRVRALLPWPRAHADRPSSSI
jgi:protein-S-isoprenylcysteine O-methyltransferase Ste14